MHKRIMRVNAFLHLFVKIFSTGIKKTALGGLDRSYVMASRFKTVESRRSTMAGYPRNEKFTNPAAMKEYFAGSRITCLRCGKNYRTLGVHLQTIHDMEPDEYREIYGIPWTYGLSCAETTKLHADDARQKQAEGIFEVGSNLHLMRGATHKPRQPIRDVYTAQNLNKMNAGKTGEVAEKRRRMTKRGTEEFKQK